MRSLVVVLAALLTSGCGIVKVSVQGSSSGGPSSGGSSSDSEPSGSSDDEAGRLKATYDDFSAKGSCRG
ncbi:MAG: hypothetical protein IPK82_38000 [Polyangiaceae bacterium]|nr:hypothetical protein [Polyangiaceae bacterium]